jgi:CheY-like chemotaxis protein
MMTKIMVVDDEPAIGKLLGYQLRGYGYDVTYVSDGLLALQRLERERPDLILLDVMLPAISGWDVCRQIRASSTIPIIMLTAKNADTDIVTGLGAGADDYIAKPFNMVQLQARIEAVLRRSLEQNGRARRVGDGETRRRGDPETGRQGDGETMRSGGRGTRSAAFVDAPAAALPGIAQTAPLPALQPTPALKPSARLGQRFREERMARGLTLNQIEHDCKIRWEFLQAIEQENFSYVPRRQLRPALHAYADYLGLDLHTLIGRPPVRPRKANNLQYVALAAAILLLVMVGLMLAQLV